MSVSRQAKVAGALKDAGYSVDDIATAFGMKRDTAHWIVYSKTNDLTETRPFTELDYEVIQDYLERGVTLRGLAMLLKRDEAHLRRYILKQGLEVTPTLEWAVVSAGTPLAFCESKREAWEAYNRLHNSNAKVANVL